MAECGVCCEVYEKEGVKCPKILPCGHTFCLQCLNKMLKCRHIKCPLCRTDLQIRYGDARRLPTNKRIFTRNMRLSKERRKIYANTTGENKNIYIPLPSRKAPETNYRETEIWQLRADHEREARADEQNDDEQNNDEQFNVIEQNFVYQKCYKTLCLFCFSFCVLVLLPTILFIWGMSVS